MQQKSTNFWIWASILLLIILFLAKLTHLKTADGSQNIKEQSIEGTYTYNDNSSECTISIYGNSWNGKVIVKSGFWSDYDNQNAQFQNGIIKDNDLYDSSGMVKVGFVSGNSLTTSIGGQQLTLSK